RRKDQVRLAERSVRILFAIDDVYKTRAHRLHTDSYAISLNQSRSCGNSLRHPLGIVIVNNQTLAGISSTRWAESPESHPHNCFRRDIVDGHIRCCIAISASPARAL